VWRSQREARYWLLRGDLGPRFVARQTLRQLTILFLHFLTGDGEDSRYYSACRCGHDSVGALLKCIGASSVRSIARSRVRKWPTRHGEEAHEFETIC
jgi:hypothetical protein